MFEIIYRKYLQTEKFYYTILIILIVPLCFLINQAGFLYKVLLSTVSVCFLSIYTFDDRESILQILKPLVLGAICIVFFDSTFFNRVFHCLGRRFVLSELLGYMSFGVGFVLLALVMKKSVFKEKNDRDYSPFKNLLTLGIICVIGERLMGEIFFPMSLLVHTSKLGLLATNIVRHSVKLGLIFSFNFLLGREAWDLFGKTSLKFWTFVTYFIMGIGAFIVIHWLISLLMSLTVYHTLLFSYQVVVRDSLDYFVCQLFLVVYLFIQTLYEEILFRTIMVDLWQGAGFAKLQEGQSNFWKIIRVSFLMSACFSGMHMANPIENGRILSSFTERFFDYFQDFFYSFSYLYIGSIAMSWGMHFMHNLSLGLYRFSASPIDIGVIEVHVSTNTMTSSVKIARSLTTIALGVVMVISAKCFVEGEKDLEIR
jgi:hypothetical protein